LGSGGWPSSRTSWSVSRWTQAGGSRPCWRTFSLHMAGVAGMLSEVPRRARNNSFSAVNALIADIYPAVGISMVSLRDTLGSSSKADARHRAGLPFNAIQADCNLIGSRLPTLRVTQNDSQTGLLNVTQLNGLMREVNDTELTLQLLSAREALNNVSKVGTEIVIWGTVEHLFSSLNSFILNNSYKVNSTVVNPVTQRASSLDETAAHLDLIRYGSFIAIASLASVVIVLWYFGVMYGLCGEPPYEDARCCNKGVGADCLTVGLVIGFISYACCSLSPWPCSCLGGSATLRSVATSLVGRAPSGYKELDSDLNQFMRFSSPDLSVYSLNLVSGLLEGCSKGNESITAALNIQNLVQGRHISQRVYGFVNESNDLLMKRRSDLVAKVALDLNFTHAESVSAAAAAQPLIPFLNELHKPLIEGSESVFAAIQNISITASKATDKARFVAAVQLPELEHARQAEMLQQSQFMSLDGLAHLAPLA
uniref:Prominin-1 n=1 Tax=Macrostomum lignano TaxID=282301 RepID=A0A1I8JQ53_9PLAT